MEAWYRRNARDLPWRRTNDPYAIWVSEIMLQQTQVQTVLPYYDRWLKALPNIRSLADANPEHLHKLWEGLGYYTRVRNLQKAARQIIQQHGGAFPQSHAAVLDLPGIGPYTAGAICSIAFGQHTPILDGNIIRVLTRLLGIRQDPREKATNQRLWRLAGDLVDAAANPSHLNQGLMELGALVCTPRQPRCELCPLARLCRAQAAGLQEKLPAFAAKPAATPKRVVALAVQRNGRWWVRQRPAGMVNGHLWEFPNVEVSRDTEINLPELSREVVGFSCGELEPLCTIQHTITRYRIRLEAYIGSPLSKGNGRRAGGCWRTLEELTQLPFPSAHKRILQRLSALAP